MRISHSLSATLLLTGLAVFLLALPGCDEATPVAPTGTLLTLTVSPTEIPVDGRATVVVFARRENGRPVNEGTVVRLSTTLGALDDEILETDVDGSARTALRGDGRIGTAEVIARSGAVDSMPVMVDIGFLAGSVSLQATPLNVRETEDGEVSLLALVRDQQGQPLASIPVNFQTQAGVLASEGAFVETDAAGQARDTLRVTESDLTSVNADNFEVSVEASGMSGVESATQTITIQRAPRARFTFTRNGLTVTFEDTSTGNPTSWDWDFDDGSTSRLQNPSHVYDAADTYTVTLEVSNSIFTPGSTGNCDTCTFSTSVTVTEQQ